MTTELTTIEQSLSPLEDKATNFIITDDNTMKEAVSLLSQLNQINDRISEVKDKVLKPLLEATKAERARWKPTELRNTTLIEALRTEMSRYQTEATKQKQLDEQKIANKVSSGYFKTETALSKLEALPDIAKNVATDNGDVQFREKKQLKVTDLSLIPDEYWHINEDDILTDLKKGMTVPGAEIEILQIPVNFR